MYKLHLILKYLRRRRIAWVSLAAVMLCTAMVIVVISIMGGWLRMYEANARGMTGDVVVKAPGLAGFAYYDEVVDRVEKLPYVEAAVPQIKTMGLVTLGSGSGGETTPQRTDGVQVFGVQIDKVGRVNNWPQSLYRQHTSYVERGEVPPGRKTFDLRTHTSVRLAGRLPATLAVRPAARAAYRAMADGLGWLPWRPDYVWDWFGDLPLPVGPVEQAAANPPVVADPPATAATTAPAAEPAEPVWDRVTFSPGGRLTVRGRLSDADRQALADAAPGDKPWAQAVAALWRESNWPGLIAGSRVIDVKRNAKNDLVGRDDWKYRNLWAKVTVLGIGAGEEIDLRGNKAETTFWVVDDSRTGIWQYDNSTVYVDFHRLQSDLGMGPKDEELRGTGEKVVRPARASEVNVRLRPGADLEAARRGIEEEVLAVIASHGRDPLAWRGEPRVQTWREASRTYLDAIEKEKVLMVLLFGIISVVAVFLIFCIFYMIVAEKTKDIGIVKSVGATNGGVAGIFLGYGLAIGVVGAGAGLLISFLIVHNINQIHDWLAYRLGLVVWNPEVYAFDTIPNRMDPPTVTVILVIAVLASVLGALVPAVRAARMHPVEALRWE